jgi:hypothetical protein
MLAAPYSLSLSGSQNGFQFFGRHLESEVSPSKVYEAMVNVLLFLSHETELLARG